MDALAVGPMVAFGFDLGLGRGVHAVHAKPVVRVLAELGSSAHASWEFWGWGVGRGDAVDAFALWPVVAFGA